jgi:DNA-binding SARP family transcriptional activator/DNA-binding XRE family transcriptional regulator
MPFTLGGLLRRYRLDAGLTQHELAARAEMSVRAVRDIEQDRVGRPRQLSLRRLAAALELSAEDSNALRDAVPAGVTDTRLWIGVLGPLLARRGDTAIGVQPERLRSLVGLLALYFHQVVPSEEIVDVLWGDRPPKTWRNQIQIYVGQVRRLLEPERQRLGPDEVLVRVGRGYRLELNGGDVDLAQFDALAARAAEAKAAGDFALAYDSLLRALQASRGPVLADAVPQLRQHPAAVAAAQRRLTALHTFGDIALALGRYEQAATRLRPLTLEEPLHEGLHAQLMVALAGCGQQAEALQVFAGIRARLAEELGIEPGVEIVDAHLRVLRQQVPAMALRHASAAPTEEEAAPPARPVPAQLPPNVHGFTGRSREFAQLDAILPGQANQPTAGIDSTLGDTAEVGQTSPGIAVIDGSPGIGKTTLAIRWCHRVAPRFPDGQLYVNLRGFGPGSPMPAEQALHALLRGLGVPPEEIPGDLAGASALLRTHTAGRRLLILLDNARTTGQVRPLLPGPGCLAVITSRNQLRGMVARDAALRISLVRLSVAESIALLAKVAGDDRVSAEPEAAAQLVELCDRIPLALRIIAERVARQHDTTLAEFVEELRDPHYRLDSFDAGDDMSTNMRTVLSWSYGSLDPDTARTFQLVGGLHPGGDVGLAAVAAVTGLPTAQARLHLDRLVAAHLVEQQRRDRYQLHDLVRAYAAEQIRRHDEEPTRNQAARRVLDWYLHTLHRADWLFSPDRPRDELGTATVPVTPLDFADERAAAQWCEVEYATLIALPAYALDHGAYQLGGQLAYLLQPFLARYKHWHDLLASHEVALEAVGKVRDARLAGHLLSAMGNAYAVLHRRNEAEACYTRALAEFRESGDRRGEVKVLGNAAMLDIESGNYDRAEALCVEAERLSTELGYARGRAHIVDNLGEIHFVSGRFIQAIACWRRALELNRYGHDRFVQTTNLTNLGRAYAALGRHPRAVDYFHRAIALSRDIDSPRGEALTLLDLGRAQRALGALAAARASWEDASRILAGLGDAKAREAQDELRAADEAAGISND